MTFIISTIISTIKSAISSIVGEEPTSSSFKPWSAEDIKTLLALYSKSNCAYLAAQFNRTESAVTAKYYYEKRKLTKHENTKS